MGSRIRESGPRKWPDITSARGEAISTTTTGVSNFVSRGILLLALIIAGVAVLVARGGASWSFVFSWLQHTGDSASSVSTTATKSASFAAVSQTEGTTQQEKQKNRNIVSGWSMDTYMAEQTSNVTCDIPIIRVDDPSYRSQLNKLSPASPFILRGQTLDWAASERWTREGILRRYGQKEIQMGSQTSVIWNFGEAPVTMSLTDYVNGMRELEKHRNATKEEQRQFASQQAMNRVDFIRRFMAEDCFSFDVQITKAIPELLRDFDIPEEMRKWHLTTHPWQDRAVYEAKRTDEAKKRGINPNAQVHDVNVVFSLGPARSGLPFHTHGQVWLGLIHGKKWWFLYPPSVSMPEEEVAKWNPMNSVMEWFEKVRPRLAGLPKPPIVAADGKRDFTAKFRPLECVQEAGDTMYLPHLWSHQTLNVGESVGVGGQALLFADETLRLTTEALKMNPSDTDSLMHSALAKMGHVGRGDKALSVQETNKVKEAVDQLDRVIDQKGEFDFEAKFLRLHALSLLKEHTVVKKTLEMLEDVVDRMDKAGISSFSMCVIYATLASKRRSLAMQTHDMTYMERVEELIDKAMTANANCLPALIEDAHLQYAAANEENFTGVIEMLLKIYPNHAMATDMKKSFPERLKEYKKIMEQEQEQEQ